MKPIVNAAGVAIEEGCYSIVVVAYCCDELEVAHVGCVMVLRIQPFWHSTLLDRLRGLVVGGGHAEEGSSGEDELLRPLEVGRVAGPTVQVVVVVVAVVVVVVGEWVGEWVVSGGSAGCEIQASHGTGRATHKVAGGLQCVGTP